MHFNNQTIRQIVRVSVGGSRLRLALSNEYGTTPLTIGAAHVALRENASAIVAGSDRALKFSGQSTMAIPAGAVLVSDPIDLVVPAVADLAVDLYLPGDTNTASPLTMHGTALQTNYVSGTGNHAGVAAFPSVATTQNWFVISRVDVAAPPSVGAVVAFGDSITDGARSTPDTNNRWPTILARRLSGQPSPMAVVDAGIGGNRVLSNAVYSSGINALARFEHDVLGQPGVTHVIVLEGINDIGNARGNPTPTADDLIALYRQLIERAHTRGGIRIYGATLTPFEGAAYFTEAGEAKRKAVNEWIRTSKVFDGVVDFDAAVRDPNHPTMFLPQFDSGDHLHPSDAGYQAMGAAVDLGLLKPVSAPTNITRK